MRGWSVSRILSRPDRDPALDDHSSAPAVADGRQAANPDLWAEASLRAVSVARPAPREVPIRHCSGWGLPCRACCQARGALLPHLFTFSGPKTGSLISVALSLGLPRPGITRHPCLMESGLSSNVAARDHPTIRAGSHLGVGGVQVNGVTRGQIADHRPVGGIEGAVGPGSEAQAKGGQHRFRPGVGIPKTPRCFNEISAIRPAISRPDRQSRKRDTTPVKLRPRIGFAHWCHVGMRDNPPCRDRPTTHDASKQLFQRVDLAGAKW